MILIITFRARFTIRLTKIKMLSLSSMLCLLFLRFQGFLLGFCSLMCDNLSSRSYKPLCAPIDSQNIKLINSGRLQVFMALSNHWRQSNFELYLKKATFVVSNRVPKLVAINFAVHFSVFSEFYLIWLTIVTSLTIDNSETTNIKRLRSGYINHRVNLEIYYHLTNDLQ